MTSKFLVFNDMVINLEAIQYAYLDGDGTIFIFLGNDVISIHDKGITVEDKLTEKENLNLRQYGIDIHMVWLETLAKLGLNE